MPEPLSTQHGARPKLPGLTLGGAGGSACRAAKPRHCVADGRTVVGTRADMSKGEIPITIEYEGPAHLRPVELLGMPDSPPQRKTDVTPDRARRRNREKSLSSDTETVVALAFGIGEPEIGVPQVLSEAL